MRQNEPPAACYKFSNGIYSRLYFLIILLAVFPLNDLHVQIAQTFREKGIPCDVIWMDIDYMDGFRCFTFDQACYSLDNSDMNIKFFRGESARQGF